MSSLDEMNKLADEMATENGDGSSTVFLPDIMLHSERSMRRYRVPQLAAPIEPARAKHPARTTAETAIGGEEEIAVLPELAAPPKAKAASLPKGALRKQATANPKQQKNQRQTKEKAKLSAKLTPKPAQKNTATTTHNATLPPPRPVRSAGPVIERYQEYRYQGKWYEVLGDEEEANWAEEVRSASGPPRYGRVVVPVLVLSTAGTDVR